MSILTYHGPVNPTDKPLIWLRGEITTPPLSSDQQSEA